MTATPKPKSQKEKKAAMRNAAFGFTEKNVKHTLPKKKKEKK